MRFNIKKAMAAATAARPVQGRWVAPNRLAVPVATGPADPNAAIYADAAARAAGGAAASAAGGKRGGGNGGGNERFIR